MDRDRHLAHCFRQTDVSQIDLSITPWIPYHKGGEQRKWYGNHEYVVNWSASGQFNRAKTTMTHVYLKPCITWSDISGNSFAGRYCFGGFMFDVKGSCAFADINKLKILIGLFNSKITPIYVEALNPTSTTQVGDLKRIPYAAPNTEQNEKIKTLVDETVSLSRVSGIRLNFLGTIIDTHLFHPQPKKKNKKHLSFHILAWKSLDTSFGIMKNGSKNVRIVSTRSEQMRKNLIASTLIFMGCRMS